MRIIASLALALTLTGALPGVFDRPLHAQRATQDEVRERRREAIRQRQERLRQRQDAARQRRSQARQGQPVTGPVSRVVRIGGRGAFTLNNLAGAITITGGGGDDVRIDATKRVWHTSEAEARALLARLEIEVTERAGGVDVRSIFPRESNYDAEVDYTVAVPAGASVAVRATSGDVRVSNVRGELRVEAVSGSITTTSVGQVRLLRTVSGSISVDNGESTDLLASTIGGRLVVRRLKAQSVDLQSVSGDIDVADSESDRVNARSLSGNVAYTGRLARSGRYTLQSQSGDIRVEPVGGDDFDVEASAIGGSVRSDFPLTLKESRVPARGRGARALSGVSGDGGALLTLRAFSGDITIARR